MSSIDVSLAIQECVQAKRFSKEGELGEPLLYSKLLSICIPVGKQLLLLEAQWGTHCYCCIPGRRDLPSGTSHPGIGDSVNYNSD